MVDRGQHGNPDWTVVSPDTLVSETAFISLAVRAVVARLVLVSAYTEASSFSSADI